MNLLKINVLTKNSMTFYVMTLYLSYMNIESVSLWEDEKLIVPEKNCLNNNVLEQNDITKNTKIELETRECDSIGNKKWKKICPNCGNIVFYSTKIYMEISIKNNRGCKKCNSFKKNKYVGMKFGSLTIIKQYNDISPCGSGIIKIDYKCDCGYIGINKRIGSVKRQKMCLSCKRRNKFKILLNGETAFNTLLSNYKKSAKLRGYLFNLTEEEFRKLTKQRCFYCGKEPSYKIKQKSTGVDYVYNGVDRKNNNEGYSVENSVSCCGVCNVLKRKLSVREFLDHIKRIYEYQFVENRK